MSHFTTHCDYGRVFSGELPSVTVTMVVPDGAQCTVRLARSVAIPKNFDLTVWSMVPVGLEVHADPLKGFISNIYVTTDTGFCVERDPDDAGRLLFVSSISFTTKSLERLEGEVKKRVLLHNSFAGSVAMRAGV